MKIVRNKRADTCRLLVAVTTKLIRVTVDFFPKLRQPEAFLWSRQSHGARKGPKFHQVIPREFLVAAMNVQDDAAYAVAAQHPADKFGIIRGLAGADNANVDWVAWL